MKRNRACKTDCLKGESCTGSDLETLSKISNRTQLNIHSEKEEGVLWTWRAVSRELWLVPISASQTANEEYSGVPF